MADKKKKKSKKKLIREVARKVAIAKEPQYPNRDMSMKGMQFS